MRLLICFKLPQTSNNSSFVRSFISEVKLTNQTYRTNAMYDDKQILNYFKEIEEVTSQYTNLWSINLYAPMILVDFEQMRIFANEVDERDILKAQGAIYSATLPSDLMIANTAVEWSGKRWAMIILPLPKNKKDRINLLAHELFHVAQPQLGFKLFSPDNKHLDDKDGRIYLRLELEALLTALTDLTNRKEHLRAALSFRQYRQYLYSTSKQTENQLELNEGIAEYTGFIIADRNLKETILHFKKSFDAFIENPTFVRSFAYQTIPLYGYLLKDAGEKYEGWHKKISVDTNLTEFFRQSFEIGNLIEESELWKLKKYKAEQIIKEENIREVTKRKKISDYIHKYIDSPRLELPLKNTNISFDPRNIMPIPDIGTYYPNLTLSDNWGDLTVTQGALIDMTRSKIYLTLPNKIFNYSAEGRGWKLNFSNEYSLKYDKPFLNLCLNKD